MRSICRMCQAIGIWVEEWCWACRESVARLGTHGIRTGSEIPADIRKWSAELFATIEELRHSIAALEEAEQARRRTSERSGDFGRCFGTGEAESPRG